MKVHKFNVTVLIILFNSICYLLLALADGKFDSKAVIYGGSALGIILLFEILSTFIIKNCDFAIIAAVCFLSSIGFVIQYRLDGVTAFKQLLCFAAGMIFFLISFAIVKYYNKLEKFYVIYAAASILMLIATLALGKSIYGAKNWIVIGGFSLQPSEFVKLTLILFMAATLNKKRNFFELIIPVSVIAVCMGIFVVQNDLGSALLLFLVTISMIFISTSNILYVLLGFSAASLGSYIAYFLFGHVRVRIEAWQNPWQDVAGNGYQIAQSLFAIAAGGWFGTGIKLDHSYLVPIVESDFVFAAVCEEFGVLMGLIVILVLLLIVYRGLKIAREAEDMFYGLLAAGCSLVLAFQAFIIIGGVIKFIPLTGITLPFISYGGTSMVICMTFVGVLEAIHSNTMQRE